MTTQKLRDRQLAAISLPPEILTACQARVPPVGLVAQWTEPLASPARQKVVEGQEIEEIAGARRGPTPCAILARCQLLALAGCVETPMRPTASPATQNVAVGHEADAQRL